MIRPRLVATDLDGTLLRSDGTVSDYTRRVLSELDRRGIVVVFVTARPLRWMDDLWPHVGAHGLAIVSNGAIVYDVAAGQVRELVGLDAEAGLRLVHMIADAVPGVCFALESRSGISRDPRFVEPHRVPAGSPVGELVDLWTEPVVKVLVRHEAMAAEPFHEAVVSAVGDSAVATWSVDGLVEISAPGVTKAAALSRVCAELGVDAADVVAFGDMPNDLPMLAWAGTSYAVSGSHPSVLAAADHICHGNDEDGVVRVLVELLGCPAGYPSDR